MIKKLIHYNKNQAGNLDCDQCGYTDCNQCFAPDLIGRKCPECGADMLSEKDYKDTVRLFKVLDWINKWFGWIGSESPDQQQGYNSYKMSIKTHDGKITIKEK